MREKDTRYLKVAFGKRVGMGLAKLTMGNSLDILWKMGNYLSRRAIVSLY